MTQKFRHKVKNNKIYIKILLVMSFFYFAFDYFNKNKMDVYFTQLINLPIIEYVVASWIYWIIVCSIAYIIWRLIDHG